MSVSLEKLRALRREAGDFGLTSKPPSPQPSPPQAGERGLGGASARRNDGKWPFVDGGTCKPGGDEDRPRCQSHSDPACKGEDWVEPAFSPLSPACGGEGWGEGGSSAAATHGEAPRLLNLANPASQPDPRAALRRLLGVRARLPDLPIACSPIDRAVPGEEIAPGLHLIQTHVPYRAPATHLPLAFARREDAVDPRALLFFDTETTGLAGGTGTRAFMIGAADWCDHPVHGDGLRIRQLLITTLAAEPAMLRVFADWLTPATVLSSYNGRCYDSPLLKTRYRLARMGDPLGALDHVDLLFPTRRRYRGTWENCRLATIERELLKIVREDDLPGSEAPAAWLGYLRGGSARNLRRVAAHNHQDVVTLARLMTRLVAVAAQDAVAATPSP